MADRLERRRCSRHDSGWGTERSRLGLLTAVAAADPSREGLAAGLWAVPAWVVVALGSAIVVGVVAYLIVRRLLQRSDR